MKMKKIKDHGSSLRLLQTFKSRNRAARSCRTAKEREYRRAGKRLKSSFFERTGTAMTAFILVFSILMLTGCRILSGVQVDTPDSDASDTALHDYGDISGESSGDTDKDGVISSVPFLVYPFRTEQTEEMSEDIADAEYSVLYNVSTGEIEAARNENDAIFPASLTKVMTLIVTVENADDLDDRVEMTYDMIAPMMAKQAAVAGFEPGDTPTVRDLLYAMILASGADAALAAAEYIAGSETAFAAMMNKKAAELGLHDTYFTNVTGLHSDIHHSTASDMAVILAYAIQNDICREVLSTETYMLAANESNPDGIELHSTLLSRMYGDEMPGVLIHGGKTGYTDQSGNCVESFADVGEDTYILVLAKAGTNWNAIYGTLSAYSVYCAGGDSYEPSRYKKTEG